MITGASNKTARNGGKRALVVDDDASHRKLLQRILSDKGFACDAADTADHARDLFDAEDYDLLTVDVVMPGESGLDLVADIRAMDRDVAVIMISGMDAQETYSRAAELGVYGYLIKPFSRNQLLATVGSAWARLMLEREARRYRDRLERLLAQRDETVASLTAANQTITDQQSKLVAQERQTALLQLAGATAHEINQPLMVILGHLELMAMDRDLPAAMDWHMAMIGKSARRIADIVKKIRHLQHDKVLQLNARDSIIDLNRQLVDDDGA